MSRETVPMSSSDNITMLIYNGNEDDCSYEKWKRRLKCGLQLKGVSYTLKDDFSARPRLKPWQQLKEDRCRKDTKTM